MASDKDFKDLVLRDVTGLTDRKELGRGAYGKVYEVTYCGKIFAAKVIHPLLVEDVGKEEMRRTVESFLKECQQCSKLRHPNIVQFLGVYYPTDGAQQQNVTGQMHAQQLPVMVMERLESSLSSRLKQQEKIPIEFKYSIVHDVSLGLCYLHSLNPPLIHRDLSSNNVLLTKFFEAKISDLGVAKAIPNERPAGVYPTQAPGTADFMPPESLRKKPEYGTPMDVFSFAGVVLHTFSEKWPTPLDLVYLDPQTSKPALLSETERRQDYLDAMTDEADSLVPLVKDCLEYNPKDRPTIESVSDKIRQDKEAYMKKFASPHDSITQQQLKQSKDTINERDKEIKQLQAEVERLKQQLQQLEQSKDTINEKDKEIKQLQAEVDCLKQQLQQQLEQSKDTINEKDKEIKQLQAEVECLKRQQPNKPNVNCQLQRLYCTDPADAVDIAMGESGNQAEEATTIPNFFLKTCAEMPDVPALFWKDEKGGPWQNKTYADYKSLVYKVAKSFQKLELEPYHSVGILGFNSVEWFASSMGAVFAGGLSTGIYTTSTAEECRYILENSRANIVVVENQEQLNKILEIRDRLPHLKAIVQYKGELSKDYPDTYTWKTFLEFGKDMEDSVINDIIKQQESKQCAVLAYTSGTTSRSKGVMLSHDNLTWITKALMTTANKNQKQTFASGGKERSVSYLPLAHISGMIADMYLPILLGSTVYIAQPDALKGSLGDTMKDVKPTLFFGVPRVWEKIKTLIEESVAESSIFKRTWFKWGYKHTGIKHNIAKNMVFKKVREKIGLLSCKHVFVGSAPMHQETFEFFKSFNVSILELYGMTECSGIHTVNFKSTSQSGLCGQQLEGVETKIIDCDGHREVLLRGRHVFMGYCGMDEETSQIIDDKRWLHSGDIGEIDENECLQVTGRIKELIKTTANGEKINPVPIECCIKTTVPFLSNVMLIGDNRNHLTCLLTLKCIINDDGEATDDLQLQVIRMIQKEYNSTCNTVSEVVNGRNQAVADAIQKGIDGYNKTTDAHKRILRWKLLEKDFTIAGRELGPTLKLRRKEVMEKYKAKIDEMYC